MERNRKSNMVCRTAPSSVTLNSPSTPKWKCFFVCTCIHNITSFNKTEKRNGDQIGLVVFTG